MRIGRLKFIVGSAILVSAGLLSGQAAWAAVQAHVDRPVVSEDDTVRLILKMTGDTDGQPDLSPLKRDFEVLGTGKSSSVTIINGHMDSHTDWNITLSPRHAGAITIPPIQVGSQASQPLQVKVVKARQAAAGGGQDVFVEAEADNTHPYVQAQVTYTVRLYYAVDLKDGDLSDPDLPNAVVKRLGKDVRYDSTQGGRRYNVVERRYAIFPQASGSLAIPAPVFSGRIPDSRPGFGPQPPDFGFGGFDSFFQSLRPVHRRGPEVKLDVRPRPAGATGADWLPAQSLSLSESWSPDPPVFRVGEPVTRTITVLARGLEGTQLPALPQSGDPGLKAYPDRPVTETQVQGVYVLGKREEKIAFVPVHPGTFTLPAIQVRWWDTGDDRPKVATLAARTVKVLPGTGSQAAGPPAALPSPATEPPAQPETGTAPSASATPLQPPAAVSQGARFSDFLAGYWPWVAGALLAVWLVTLWLWRRERREQPTARAPREPDGIPAAAARRDLQHACAANDPAAARDALLAWGQAVLPERPPRTLGALAEATADPAARAAIEALDRALYAPSGQAWDGAAFGRTVGSALESSAKSRRDTPDPLPALYPGR